MSFSSLRSGEVVLTLFRSGDGSDGASCHHHADAGGTGQPPRLSQSSFDAVLLSEEFAAAFLTCERRQCGLERGDVSEAARIGGFVAAFLPRSLMDLVFIHLYAVGGASHWASASGEEEGVGRFASPFESISRDAAARFAAEGFTLGALYPFLFDHHTAQGVGSHSGATGPLSWDELAAAARRRQDAMCPVSAATGLDQGDVGDDDADFALSERDLYVVAAYERNAHALRLLHRGWHEGDLDTTPANDQDRWNRLVWVVFELVLRELRWLSAPGELRRLYDVWPLFHTPGLVDELEREFPDADIETEFGRWTAVLRNLKHAVRSGEAADFQRCVDEGPCFRIFCEFLMPSLLQECPSVREPCFWKSRDTCIHLLRRGSFLAAEFEPLLRECIQFEGEVRGPEEQPVCLLFRASEDLRTDAPVRLVKGEVRPHSLSFGASLFSGILQDETACVWAHFSRRPAPGEPRRRLFAVSVPTEEAFWSDDRAGISESFFHVPPVSSLLSLAGVGEMFHPRTRVVVPDHADPSARVSGIHAMAVRRLPDFLRRSAQECDPSDFTAALQKRYGLREFGG
jgi:hypothetical protein